LQLLAGVLEEIEFLTPRMAECANSNFLTVTELADTLVRETGMSFRTAHEIVSEAVKHQEGQFDANKMVAAVEALLRAEYKQFHMPDVALLRKALDAEHFVAVRKITGGPAAEVLEPEIERSRRLLAQDREWLENRRKLLTSAEERLRSEANEALSSARS
jgi:argininosuccinate lyase